MFGFVNKSLRNEAPKALIILRYIFGDKYLCLFTLTKLC